MRYTLDPNHPHPEDLDDGRRVAPGEDVEVEDGPNVRRLVAFMALLPAGDDPGAPTDDELLANPGAYNVDDVVAALARHPDQAQDAQALEAGGKARKTIIDWQPPEPGGDDPDPED